MAKIRNKKRENKIKKLVAMVIICAIVLSVSTYAWFIGMKTVKINSFDINIKTTEGLFLSMDGKKWSYNLTVDKESSPYEGHTNTFAEDGLIPMSSIGEMNNAASTMKLFEKGSLTSTPGGMRLLASKVKNETIAEGSKTATEGVGYVAFDLFVKNIFGKEYYVGNDPLNEEAIYLTTNSAVKVGQAGATTVDEGQKNTGIENSVRVGFTQIGRVSAEDNEGATADADVAKITGITCTDDTTNGVTGICRKAQIWEPNDAKHVQNALNWYKTSCLIRNTDGTDVYDKNSYGTKCSDLELNKAYPTYAISDEVSVEDNVNIYDGEVYNTYTKSTKLVSYPYFTDTMKMKEGVDRPEFMTLAPNSITKVRVYVWLEGQDIDNYDFASLGQHIAINFGFTKERFKEDDIGGYDGPSTGKEEKKTEDPTETPEV